MSNKSFYIKLKNMYGGINNYTIQQIENKNNNYNYEYNLYLNGIHIGISGLFVNINNEHMINHFRLFDEYKGKGHGRHLYFIFEKKIKDEFKTTILSLRSSTDAFIFWRKMGYYGILNKKNTLHDMKKKI